MIDSATLRNSVQLPNVMRFAPDVRREQTQLAILIPWPESRVQPAPAPAGFARFVPFRRKQASDHVAATAGGAALSQTVLLRRGVPLWIVLLLAFAFVRRHRQLRGRPGNVTVRIRAEPGQPWNAANGVWVDDVFAVRTGIADRNEATMRVTAVTARQADEVETRDLKKLEDPVIATLNLADGGTVEVAVPRPKAPLVFGPFAADGTVLTEIFASPGAGSAMAAAS